jgi:serine/threonine protein kinase
MFFGAELEAVTDGFAEEMCIGGGGFGKVYKAVGLVAGSDDCYAVKRLDQGSMQGLPEVLQEVQVLGGCRHQNVLPLFGFSVDGVVRLGAGGWVCLVTKLMRGGCLEDRMYPLAEGAARRLELVGAGAQPAALVWAVRVRVGAEVAAGLEYLHTPDAAAHKPAILHRDLKPANVLLDAGLKARLGDAGLARAKVGGQSLQTSMHLVGTPGFLDPNYQNTGRFDESCDGYALGVTLLMLLTGRRAWEGQETLIDFCTGRNADVLADPHCQWPSEVAEGVLEVARGLVVTPRRDRISVRDARRRLEALAPPPPDQGGEVERECVICLAAARTTRFGECRHSQLCAGECLERFFAHGPARCPQCRGQVRREALLQGAHIAQEPTFVQARGN